MSPQLSPADVAYYSDPSTYRGGPTFDLSWELHSGDDLHRLRSALLDDPTISQFDLAPRQGGDFHVTWRPNELLLLVLGVSSLDGDPAEVYAWAYPDHINRITGIEWRTGERERLPATRPLFGAGIALTRRIHHRVPLLRAAVTVEGIDDDIPETGVIAIPRGLAEAANWTHTSSANPKAAWHTLIPFER